MVSGVFKQYKKVIHGVAFIPLVITITMAGVAIGLTAFSENGGGQLVGLPDYLRIGKVETARVLLGSILTGMIALTVFGFSMMIVVVNQAASIYSPKVVDTLLEEKNNKLILGFYLGTIVFTIITLMHLDNSRADDLPHFAVLLNILFQTISILLFVAFVNHISNSARITEIIQRIYSETKHAISAEASLNCSSAQVNTDNWVTIDACHSGYFQVVRIKPLVKLLAEHNLILKILPHPGDYYSAKTPLFEVSRPIGSEISNAIRNNFVTYPGEAIDDNTFYGFRQLREIAVKALSPGVNDPGVARLCIDHLGDLLARWMMTEGRHVVIDESGQPRIILRRYDFESLLNQCITPIKLYGRRDFTVIVAILEMFNRFVPHDEGEIQKAILNKHTLAIIEDADRFIRNTIERKLVNDAIRMLNPSYFDVSAMDGNRRPEAPL